MLKTSILALVATLAATTTAGAFGALAIGGSPSEAQTKGIAVGIVQNYGTAAEAEAQAVQKCLAFTGAPKKTVARCKVLPARMGCRRARSCALDAGFRLVDRPG
jgi:hypothetical protein